MNLKMLFVAGFVLFLCAVAHSEHIFGAFDMKSTGNKTMYYQKKWHKYKCTFTYKAQGAKEQWQFIFQKLDDGKLLQCTVQRGTTSYLQFENFTMSLTGPRVHLETYHAISYLEQALKDTEVRMDKTKKTVYAVENEFQQKLERLTLTARVDKKKDEL